MLKAGRGGWSPRAASRASLLLLLAACARVQAPPGGPTDLIPPRLVSTAPDSLVLLPGFDGAVEFRFDEVVSEGGSPNFGLGTGDLEKLVVLSPTLSVPSVRWRRSRLTVRPRDGWQPNTVYRVELLSGLADLSGNRSKNGGVVTFSTGAPLPSASLSGLLVDWNTRRPLARGLVEAILMPDSLPYRTNADSTGRFVLMPIPAGEYLVYGAQDQNNDRRVDRREAFDSLRAVAGRDSVGELWVFRHDSTANRLTTVARNDSLSLLLTFAQPLNPYQQLPADSIEVRLLPDSLPIGVTRLLSKEQYDSVFAVKPKPDTSAAARAKADSLRADSLARAIVADSLARARAALAIRIPGAQRRREQTPDTAGTGPLRTRPALSDKVVVRLAGALQPGATYLVVVHGVENVSRVAGTTRQVVKVPVPAKPDSTRARRDTTKTRPDTAKTKPDTARVTRR